MQNISLTSLCFLLYFSHYFLFYFLFYFLSNFSHYILSLLWLYFLNIIIFSLTISFNYFLYLLLSQFYKGKGSKWCIIQPIYQWWKLFSKKYAYQIWFCFYSHNLYSSAKQDSLLLILASGSNSLEKFSCWESETLPNLSHNYWKWIIYEKSYSINHKHRKWLVTIHCKFN